jgi:hypothetical protein
MLATKDIHFKMQSSMKPLFFLKNTLFFCAIENKFVHISIPFMFQNVTTVLTEVLVPPPYSTQKPSTLLCIYLLRVLAIKNMATLYLFVLLNHLRDIKFATFFKPVEVKPPLLL